MSLTRAYAAKLQGLYAEGLDAPSRAAALALVRDGIAVAVAGADEPGPRILRDLALAGGASPAATMIGGAVRTSPTDAARANGAAMHVLDWEPMWNPANHSLSTTLPAVLALAEAAARRAGPFAAKAPFAVTGERLLTALAIGIEAQARMRGASGQLDPGQLKFHPPGAVGAFGAATACGLLLGLDESALAHALAIAASRASGIQANIGSMTKALHCGGAAAAGLESALMAAAGFTGDADALGDPRGYGQAFYAGTFDPAPLTADIAALHIVVPGPAWKLFPSQYATHFAITAALAARSQMTALGAGTEAIESIRLVTPLMPYVDRPAPATGLAGKFSFQYTACAALLDGAVTVASFKDQRRFSPDMEALLKRAVVEPDKGREGRFDRLTLDIEVMLTDGRRVTATCAGPPGIWGQPVPPERLTAKWRDALQSGAGPERALRISHGLDGFAACDGSGLLALMDAIAGT